MEALAREITAKIDQSALPGFIAVEGPIGVGKTSLVKRLAESFNYQLLLEQPEENPFLPRFYEAQRGAALPTQLHFLFQRLKQLEELRQSDIFKPLRAADFLIDKDPLFAGVTLDDDELRLYQKVYQQLTIDAPVPDLVVYLQAPTEVLMERVQRRGVPAEKKIQYDYLSKLNDAYTQFFYYYDEAPLLIVNATEIDLVNNDDDYFDLIESLLAIKSGRHYYNPHLTF